MVISKDPITCKPAVDGITIEQMMELQQVGITLSSDGSIENQVEGQVKKDGRVAGWLSDTIWPNRYIQAKI